MKSGIGIIGLGGIASTAHAPAIATIPEAWLAAVLSRNNIKGQEFLAKHNALQGTAYDSLESFVADPNINLVIVCSPDGLHFEQAAACLNAGKHVLLEKPMTLKIEEAEELVNLAESKNLTLAIGFHLRSHNGLRLLHERVIAQREIGDIRHIRAIWAFPQQDDTNWRAKNEMAKWWSLSAVGSHCLDLARWFAGDEADWAQFTATTTNNLWGGSHDETAIVAAELESGITVEIVSSVQFGAYNRLELFGSQGIVLCDDVMGREGGGKVQINDQYLEFEILNPYREQLNNVLECIETGRAPRATGTVGVRNVKDLVLAGASLREYKNRPHESKL